MKKLFFTLTIAASQLTLPLSVDAEESSTLTLEEVVVTAQRRSQSLQDVPISMSVVSAGDMTRNSIFDFTDTAALTPGVSLNSSSAALASVTVRGVGPGFFSPVAQSVPIFVDEIPAAQPGAVFNTMIDVERVELLRGPQGTLYGKNAPSGAYNITTVAPSFDGVEGFVSGSYSRWDSNGEPTTDARGAINIPLSDKLAVRLSGVYAESEGGFDMKSPFATNDASGGKDHQSVRAKLRYQIGDSSQLQLIANYQDLEDNYALRTFDGLVPGTGGTNLVPAIFTSFSDREDFAGERSNSTTEVKDLALKYEWNGDLTNIDLILSYQDFKTSLFQNQSSFPTLTPGSTVLALDSEQMTFELRASNSGEVFDYVTGIFVSDLETNNLTDIQIGASLPSQLVEETFGAAIFGNFTFHLADQWDLAVGIRYEDNSQDYKSTASISGFGGDLDEDLDFDHLSWSLKLNYFINDETTAYLAIDNAFRQGGLNAFTPAMGTLGALLGSPAIQATAEAFTFYDEEVSTAFEIGLKGSMLENRLRYNLALFYQEYDDHIIRQNDPTSPQLATLGALYTLVFVNAEEVVTQGVEFDLTYLLTDNWTIDFRSAYFDATVDEWATRLCTFSDGNQQDIFCPAESGTELSNLPKYNVNTQLSYFTSLDSGWDFYSTLSWSWRSDPSIGSVVTDRYDESLNFVNLNIGLRNDTFSATAWGKNLTDEGNNTTPNLSANGDPSLPAALTTTAMNAGRQYGVTLTYNF